MNYFLIMRLSVAACVVLPLCFAYEYRILCHSNLWQNGLLCAVRVELFNPPRVEMFVNQCHLMVYFCASTNIISTFFVMPIVTQLILVMVQPYQLICHMCVESIELSSLFPIVLFATKTTRDQSVHFLFAGATSLKEKYIIM